MSSSCSSPASRSVTEFQSGDGVNDLARCFTCCEYITDYIYFLCSRFTEYPHLDREEASVATVSIFNQNAVSTFIKRYGSF